MNSRTTYLVGIVLAAAGIVILAAVFYRGHRSASRATAPVTTAPPPAVPAAAARTEPARGSQPSGNQPPDVQAFARIRALLRSGGADPKVLRRELSRLALSADPEALAILKEALASRQPQIRALAALVLAAGHFPEAAELLRPLLRDPAPEVVCAAVRALAEVDTAGLRQWGLPALDTGDLPTAVQAEILMALARHGDEVAIEKVMNLAVDGTDTNLVTAMLDRVVGLAPDVAVPLFQAIINAPGSTSELKGQAIEALSDVDVPDAAALLLHYASGRPSVTERRQAAEALGTVPDAQVSAAELVTTVTAESDLATRVHLYDAMRNLADPDPAVLLPALRAEQDPQARTAALLTAGTLVGMDKADAAMQAYFEDEGIALCETSALSQALASDYRMRAISALRNAGTEAARAALARLAQSDDDFVQRLASRPLPQRQR